MKRGFQVISIAEIVDDDDNDNNEELVELGSIEDQEIDEADLEVINVNSNDHQEEDLESARKKIKLEDDVMVSPFYADYASGSKLVLCSDVVSKIMQYLPYFQTVKLIGVSSEWKQAQCRVTTAYIKEGIKSNILKQFIESACFKNLTSLDVRPALKSKTWFKIFKRCTNMKHLRIRQLDCTILKPDLHNTNLNKLQTIVIDKCSFIPGNTLDLKYAISSPYLYNLKILSVGNLGNTRYTSLISVRERLTELKLDNITTKFSPVGTPTFQLGSLTKLDLRFTTLPLLEISSILSNIFLVPGFINLTHLRLKTSKGITPSMPITVPTESNLIYLNIGNFGDAFLAQLLKYVKFEKLEHLYIDKVESAEVIREIENNSTLSGLKTLSIRHIHTNCEEELASIPEKFTKIEYLQINQCSCVDSIENFLIYPYTNLKNLSLKWSIGKFVDTDIGAGAIFDKLESLVLHILPIHGVANGRGMPITMDSDFSNIKDVVLNTSITSLATMMYSAPMNKVKKLDVTIYDDASAEALVNNTSFQNLRAIKVRYDQLKVKSESLDAIIRRFSNYKLGLYFFHNSK